MDWADEKAREFFADYLPSWPSKNKELAALLREVAYKWEQIADTRRDGVLREARRAVEGYLADVEVVKSKGLISEHHGWGRQAACREILSRLEALK